MSSHVLVLSDCRNYVIDHFTYEALAKALPEHLSVLGLDSTTTFYVGATRGVDRLIMPILNKHVGYCAKLYSRSDFESWADVYSTLDIVRVVRVALPVDVKGNFTKRRADVAEAITEAVRNGISVNSIDFNFQEEECRSGAD